MPTAIEDKMAETASISTEKETLNYSESSQSIPNSAALSPPEPGPSTSIRTDREVTPYDRNIVIGLNSPMNSLASTPMSAPTNRAAETPYNYQSRLRAAALAHVRLQQNQQQMLCAMQQQERHRNRRHRNPGLCPCFSPTQSSDDETDSPQEHRSNSGGIMNRWMANLRYRINVPSEPTPQSTVTYRRCGQGVSLQAPPYPVHSTIAYTHYLVPKLNEITKAPYYWGKMNRFEAEKLLDGKPEGTFLLRDSAQIEYVFSVSFRRYNRTLHARIEQSEHRFSFDSFDQNVFSAPTVTELIQHYKDREKCMFFEPQLTNPLPRNFPFDLQHLCRSVICTNLKEYGAIDQLPLPLRQLGDYLKEYHYKQQVSIRNAEPINNAIK